MHRRLSGILASAALLTGCMGAEVAFDDGLVLTGPTDTLAVGVAAAFTVGDACTAGAGRPLDSAGPGPDSRCTTEQITAVLSVDVSPPDALTVRQTGAGLQVTPLRPGAATLTVRARLDDGSVRTAQRAVSAHLADRVVVGARCENVSQPGATQFVSEHSRVSVDAHVLRPHVQFDGGPVPWVGEGLLPVDAHGRWGTPAADVPVTLSSSIDPALAQPIALFGPADVDRLDVAVESVVLGSDQGSAAGRYLTVSATTRVQGEIPCVDQLPRTVQIHSPSVCQFGDGDHRPRTVRNSLLSLTVRQAGVCRFEVSLGDGRTARVEVPVEAPPG